MNDPEGVEPHRQGQRPWNGGEEKAIEADVSEFSRETLLALHGL